MADENNNSSSNWDPMSEGNPLASGGNSTAGDSNYEWDLPEGNSTAGSNNPFAGGGIPSFGGSSSPIGGGSSTGGGSMEGSNNPFAGGGSIGGGGNAMSNGGEEPLIVGTNITLNLSGDGEIEGEQLSISEDGSVPYLGSNISPLSDDSAAEGYEWDFTGTQSSAPLGGGEETIM